jgi:translation initiation factor 1
MSVENEGNSRLVYSSEGGRVAPERSGPARQEALDDGIVRVGRTSSGRRGKTVTLVTGLPPGELDSTAKELKRLCGSGGAVKDGVVEVQGDHRDRIVERLSQRHRVKRTGG